MDAVDRIARAVLYEGYILWPYRRSALKNRQRWTFGGVFPQAYSAAQGEADPWQMRAECLLQGDDGTTLDVRLRFLHVVERQLARCTPAGLEFVDELRVGGTRHLSWVEATEREVMAPRLQISALLGTAHRQPITIPAGTEQEWLRSAEGERAGAIVRRWRALEGLLEIQAERLASGPHRIRLTLSNTTRWGGDSREETQKSAFVSTHAVLRAEGGEFLSLTDPPEELREAAASCRNLGAWPVLVGEQGERHTVLAAPIILPDYPQIAPESPGDLFDGTEIDQLLILSILALSEEEQAEMRASDPRAREILERCTSLTPEQLMRLHGTIRDFRTLQVE